MRHFFLRDSQQFPVACIATEKKENVLQYGLSVCNPKDFKNFNPARAVHTATERLRYFLEGKYEKRQCEGCREFIARDADKCPTCGREKDKTKPDFESSKFGVVNFQTGQSPKLELLERLAKDHDLPSRLRAAAIHGIQTLKVKMVERIAADHLKQQGEPSGGLNAV